MKRWLFATMIFLGMANIAWAQGYHHGRGHSGNWGNWPDSLTTVEVTGTVLVDSTAMHNLYYLDTDNDGNADYHLAFGPYWYVPASGATLPADGETITVVGAVMDGMTPPSLVVFEINGLQWREPVEFGMRGWNGHDPWDTQGDTLTVSGVVLVDTTYFYPHYYLDTDGDGTPEYQLGFGPPWYTPATGVTRPAAGETVTIFGLRHDENMMGYSMLIVLKINDVEWRSATGPAPWSGQWMHRNRSDSARVYCVNDSSSWMQFPPGNMGHGNRMGMWPDSVFVQFWRVHPDSLPGAHQNGRFAGYYINVQDPNGRSMMGRQMGWRRGHMKFEQAQHFHFQYRDEDLTSMGLHETNMKMVVWNEDSQQWQDVTNASINTEDNTVTLDSDNLSSYYALVAAVVPTAVTDNENGGLPTEFALEQNYPNPFNPATTIRFALAREGQVRLEIFNLLGQKVATLINEVKPAGYYTVKWNGSDDTGRTVNSGLYLVRLQAGEQVSMRQMTLLK